MILVWKECVTTWRSPHRWLTETSMGAMLALLLGMALNPWSTWSPAFAAGLVWILVYFSTGVGAFRGESPDWRWRGMWTLWLSPVPRFWTFYAKWMGQLLWLIPSAIVQWLALWMFMDLAPPRHALESAGVAAVGLAGLSGLAVWIQTLTQGSQGREVLAPFLLFPLAVPMLLGLVRLTAHALTGVGPFPWLWAEFLVGYVVCGGLIPWILYDVVTEA